MEDDWSFEVFRHLRIKSDLKAPRAVFMVRFKPYMSVKKNIRFSRLSMMIFMGFRRFREKYRAVGRENWSLTGMY
jgi:hypothetical protein